jgi:hypothetical protein
MSLNSPFQSGNYELIVKKRNLRTENFRDVFLEKRVRLKFTTEYFHVEKKGIRKSLLPLMRFLGATFPLEIHQVYPPFNIYKASLV